MRKKLCAIFLLAMFILVNCSANGIIINYSEKKIIDKITQPIDIDNLNIYVDKNIFLTKINLQSLKRAVTQIQDQEYKKLTQKIIDELEKKGQINSYNIKNILIELGMYSTDVYFGFINTYIEGGMIIFSIPIVYMPLGAQQWLQFWIGPGVSLFWDINSVFSGFFKINKQTINVYNKGIALVPIGLWFKIGDPQNNIMYLSISAFSPLIFITED